jgi:hypothetical protein
MKPIERHEVEMTLEDLAQIVCEGNVEGELRDRVAAAIRTDPRFTQQFEQLEVMAAEIGAEDLWEGVERNDEFDRLLAAESWEDPAEILNPDQRDYYEIGFRKLIAVADARLSRTDDPGPIQAVKDRLLLAEEKFAKDAVFKVAEAVKSLSADTAEKIFDEVRRDYFGKGQDDAKGQDDGE